MKSNDFNDYIEKFFRVISSRQAYLNLLYVLLSFPLSIFYFVFLVTGLTTGIPLIIIWIGIPLLVLVGIGWWLLAALERQMAIHWLKEDIPPMTLPPTEGADLVTRFRDYFTNIVTWKSLVYLFGKFPLGILNFIVWVTMVAFTLTFLGMPFFYQFFGSIIPVVVDFGGGMFWYIDSLSDALIASVFGIFLWPVTLHILNGVAWVNGKFAKVMLGLYKPVKSVIPPGQMEKVAEIE